MQTINYHKPKYWKYSFDFRADKVIVRRRIVEGNNIMFLKSPKDKALQKSEWVTDIPVNIPTEEYEAFREVNDWGAFSVSERFNRVSLGMKKRLDVSVIADLKKELEAKYPLEIYANN